MKKPITGIKINSQDIQTRTKQLQDGTVVISLVPPKQPKQKASGDTTIWAKVIAIPTYATEDPGIVHYVVKQVASDWSVTGDAIEISAAINALGQADGAQDIRNYIPWYDVGSYVRIKKKFITEIVESKTAVIFTKSTNNFNAIGIGSGVEVGDMALVSGTNITASQYAVTEVTDANNIIFSGMVADGIIDGGNNIDSVVSLGNGKYWHIDEDMIYTGTESQASLRWSGDDSLPQAVWI